MRVLNYGFTRNSKELALPTKYIPLNFIAVLLSFASFTGKTFFFTVFNWLLDIKLVA